MTRLQVIGMPTLAFFFSCASLAAEAPIAQLHSDQESYKIGEVATLTVRIDPAAIATTDEVILKSNLGPTPVTSVDQSGATFVFQSAAFQNAGIEEWEVLVVTQNRAAAVSLSTRITVVQADLATAQKELAAATTPTQKAELERQIRQDETTLTALEQALVQLEHFREADSLPIHITS